MNIRHVALALLASSAIGVPHAMAQTNATPGASTSPAEAPPVGAPVATAQANGSVATPASEQDINQLRAEVAALQARLDQMQQAQGAAPAAPGEAPAAVAANAPTTATTPPAPVAATTAKPAAPGWFANTTIGGKAYINVSDIHQRSDGLDTSQNGLQTDVKRFYLVVDHKFSDVFSANLTTDFRYGTNGLTKDDVLYVKKAYLQAKLSPEFFVRIGAADLPWVPFVEDVYGYRFVENTLIDRTKYGTSSDWGVHIGGTFGNGLISYAVSAIDGQGYKTLARSSDTIDLEGRVSAQPIKNVVLAVGGYTGKLGKSSAGAPDTDHRASRFDALAAYTSARIRAGVEYFEATDWNNVATVQSDRSSGISAFGSYAFTPKLALFGRYDWVNPNQRTDAPLIEHYYNVGVDLQPIKNIDMALVYKRDKADNGLVATSNGTIGGTDDGTYDEIGIWTQLKF